MLQEVPKKINIALVGEKTDFGSQLSWRRTREERGVKGTGRHSRCIRRLSIKTGKRGLARGAGEAAAKPGRLCPPSSCHLAAGAGVLQRLHQSTQHQHPLQVHPAKDFSGLEPSTQAEALPSWLKRPNPGQPEARLPNKETKAFAGPRLLVVTCSPAPLLPRARHCAKHRTGIGSQILTATRGNRGTERASAS